MAGLMFDSDNPTDLENPLFAGCRVATYADLLTPAIVSQFAGRLIVIDRGHGDPMSLAHVLDIESGAYTIEAAAARAKEWANEKRPFITAYTDRSNWQPVLDAMRPLDIYSWVATLDGTLNPVSDHPTAVQFDGETQLGLHADVSVIWADAWCPVAAAVSSQAVSNVRQQAAALLGQAESLSKAVAGL